MVRVLTALLWPVVIIYRTSIDHPDDHHPLEAESDIPGRFELGVARRDGTLGDLLKKINAAAQETKCCEQMSIIQMAMDAACTNKFDDKKTFSKLMIHRNPDDCREEIYRFDSERKAGELKNIRNLPALLTKRLTDIPAIY